jgi:hypothetical protein
MSDHSTLTTWFNITLATARNETMAALGDTVQKLWSNSEIEGYLKEAYALMTLGQLIIWDWDSTIPIVAGNAVYDLPEDHLKTERVTYNSIRLVPLTRRDIEMSFPMFHTTGGWVWAYIQDADGLGKIRLDNVPTDGAVVVPGGVITTGTYGAPRRTNGEPETGTYGLMRESLTGFAHSGTYGIARIVSVAPPLVNPVEFKIEFYRRGRLVANAADTFELPARYVKYLEFYALWRAYERQSSGQFTDLAVLYKTRWQDALTRLKRRKNAVKSAQVPGFAGPSSMTTRTANPRPALPWNWGPTV